MSDKIEVQRRDANIDFLRFVGISLIILAHVGPPTLLFNLRGFDVPLMLFVSGLAYSGKKADARFSFFVHRALRLLVPVYIFLTLYFSMVFFSKHVLDIDFGITVQQAISSYLLMGGIGYVWIIRVFLIIAMLTPLLIKIKASIKGNLLFGLFLVAVMVAQEVLVSFDIGTGVTVVSEFVYYATGYSVLFLLGLKINGMKRLSPWLISATAIFAISLVYVFLRFDTLLVYKFKSPPQFHFIAYGAMMSIACFAIVKKLKGIKGVGLINFIGQNTIWIYLWHIPLIQFTKLLGWQWCIRYVCVYVVAVAICYVQVRIVDAVQSRYGIKALKYLKG